MISEVCNDNRFEIIEKYKKILIEKTNIETSEKEMQVLDAILFRMWQLRWLDKLEQNTKDCLNVSISVEDLGEFKEECISTAKNYYNNAIEDFEEVLFDKISFKETYDGAAVFAISRVVADELKRGTNNE